MSDQAKHDIRLVDLLLRGIREGRLERLSDRKADFDEIRQELVNGDVGASIRFETMLKTCFQVHEAVVDELSAEVLSFVTSELKRLSEIREQREFTEDEETYGRSVLPGLLTSLRELV